VCKEGAKEEGEQRALADAAAKRLREFVGEIRGLNRARGRLAATIRQHRIEGVLVAVYVREGCDSHSLSHFAPAG